MMQNGVPNGSVANNHLPPSNGYGYTQSSPAFPSHGSTPHHPDDVVQSLEIRYKSLAGREAVITDGANPTILYSVDFRNRKPNLHFKHGEAATDFATGVHHCFTSLKLAVTIAGTELTLTPRRLVSNDYTWASPAFGGQQMLWDHRGHLRSVEFILLDPESRPVARLDQKAASLRHMGTLEILGRCPPAARDEVVATGLTLAHYIQVRNLTSVNAAAASAGSSAAVA